MRRAQIRAPRPTGQARTDRGLRLVTRAAAASLVLVLALGPLWLIGASAAEAAPAQGASSGCGNLPVIGDTCRKLADTTSWVADCSQTPEGCGQSINDTVVAGAFDYFARWVAVGALATIDMQWEAITNTTTPSLGSDSSVFRTSMLTAQALALPLLVGAGLYSLVKRDAQIAIKSAVFYLPLSVIGMIVMGFILQLAIEVTDTLSLNYVSDTKFGVLEWLLGLEDQIVAGVGVTAPVLLVIFSLVLMAASLLLWLIMLVRSAVIMVVFVFMPLAFAAMIFPSTRGWIKRLIEVELSFILAKPVIMAVLALGASTLNEAENAMVAMMQASALFFLASFAPFALMKLLPIVSDQAVAAIEGPALAPRRTVGNALGAAGVMQATRFLAGSQHERGGEMAAGVAAIAGSGSESSTAPVGSESGSGVLDFGGTSGGGGRSVNDESGQDPTETTSG